MRWTTPADLTIQVENLWNHGSFLSSLVRNTSLFPKRLLLKSPTALEMVNHFDEVRAWIKELQTTPGCRIETRNFRHRELGNNAIPAEAWIDCFDDAVALIGKESEVALFTALLNMTTLRQPEWITWLARRPLQALELARDWDRFLDIAAWCQKNPRCGLYFRQMDVPDVHTKFVEAHRGTLAELLDLALPEEAIDRNVSGVDQFDIRYGFRKKPARIRFRILDQVNMPSWPGEDLTVTVDAFARLNIPASIIFIVENEINFLAFPSVRNSLVIFGTGFGVELLRHSNWLSNRCIYYWGDVDTHGFAILDQLRHHFDHVASFMMDHETFMTFRHLAGVEPVQSNRDLATLTNSEQSLYDDLRNNKFGKNLRLEQEKISFNWVELAVKRIINDDGHCDNSVECTVPAGLVD